MYQDRTQLLKDSIAKRILVLDGATGTAFQSRNLTAEDFGGEVFEGCNENLVLSRPDVVEWLHEIYLEAGADIIETNTFGGTPLVLDEFELGSKAYEINKVAAEIACRAAEKYSTPEKPRFVAGSIGPTTKAISVTGGITFHELVTHFEAQAQALWDGGVDYFLIETCQDTRNVKAAIIGIRNVFEKMGAERPIAVSGTIEPMGTMLAGQSVDALVASLLHVDLLYLGLNCATGPEFMTDHIRTLSAMAPWPVACVPNAGLPDEEGDYLETPEMMCQVLGNFVNSGWINLIGGCCGTTPGHIKAFSDLVKGKEPRQARPTPRSALSGIEYFEVEEENRPVIVGERTNVIGSRKFKKLICDGKFEEASEIARGQVKKGAQIIDVCLANPDREECEDMVAFLDQVVRKVKAPLMLDSTDEAVLAESLTYCQGKSIINSINLEDGEERFEKVVPLAKKFGAALVVGTIDDDPDQGMGVSFERKMEIARRSFDLLTKKYAIAPEDIYWDPLVFPVGTGDVNYVGSAPHTIRAITALKKEFPGTKTVLGVSNVSFGLPQAGREVLNSVYLYHCVKAGLDLAIVNSQKLERYASLGAEDIKVSDDLLFNRGEDPVAAFAAHFRGRKAKEEKPKTLLPLDERLALYVVEGSKEGLIPDIELKLKESTPLEIINGPLMKGMDEVGRLFGSNQLIVAEVLQSAEVMKAAVAHLEPMMAKNEASSRGKILLATVKGDVHDIGKNLVEIILANNGFNVINLGIKVPPEKLIEAIAEHQPDIVGLSGLLVKSAQQMVLTAEDFFKAGIQTPIMVGGAALSEKFVDKKIARAYSSGTVTYARDAMGGLDLAKQIVEPAKLELLQNQMAERRSKLAQSEKDAGPKVVVPKSTKRSESVAVLDDLPQPPDYNRHLLVEKTPIEVIWKYINPMMLYGRHLGIRGGAVRKFTAACDNAKLIEEIRAEDPKAIQIWEAVQKCMAQYRNKPQMKPVALYQFFHVWSEGNTIHLEHPKNSEKAGQVVSIEFPRMEKAPGYCIADFVHPDKKVMDNIALFAVSVGREVREESERLKNAGEFLQSQILQALALESAEGYAEYLHSQIRRMWGHGDSPEMTMLERFQAKYFGKRYSFGYPACPNLEDQRVFFDLVRPEDLGVELTDGFMMEPEASVTALVFHHPKAAYFSVGNQLGDLDG